MKIGNYNSQVVNSEPVGFVSITPVGLNNEVSVIWINKYKPKHGENLFTTPQPAPDTVPREEYDKLLEALKFYANLDWKENTQAWQLPALQAIAEAEGK